MTMRHDEVKVWFPAIRAGTGTDVFTERLSEGLKALGVHVEVTWLPHRAEYLPWSLSTPLPPLGTSIVHINTRLHPRFIPKRIPTIATMHLCVHDPALSAFKTASQFWYHRWWVAKLEASVLRRADRVIAVSRYTAHRTQEAFGLGSVDVIHNGVDTRFFSPPTARELHRPFRLLYLGNWSGRKGVDLLRPIMERLGQGFELRYTGGGAKLPSNCYRMGRLDRAGVRRALHNADALIFPTRLEGFGLVAAEAMACGVPVVVSRSSSLPEIVSDGRSGFLCEPEDVEEFARAIELLAEPRRWHHMSAQALIDCRERFDERTMVKAYLDVYKSMLGISGAGRARLD